MLTPIGDSGRSRLLVVAAFAAACVAVITVVAVVTSSGSSSESDSVATGAGVPDSRIRLLDTRSSDGAGSAAGAEDAEADGVDGDGAAAGGGQGGQGGQGSQGSSASTGGGAGGQGAGLSAPADPIAAGTVVEVDVAGQQGISGDVVAAALDVGASGNEIDTTVAAFACGADQPDPPQLHVPADTPTTQLVLSHLDSDGAVCLAVDEAVHLTVDVRAAFTDDVFDRTDAPRRLVDTRSAGSGAAELDRTGPVAPDETLEVPIAGLDEGDDGDDDVAGAVALEVAVVAEQDATVTVAPCGDQQAQRIRVHARAGVPAATSVFVDPGPQSTLCATSTAPADLVIDLFGIVDPGVVRFGAPTRLVDTTPDGTTVDGAQAAKGVRPAHSTLQVEAGERLTLASGTEALLVNVTAQRPQQNGHIALFPPSWTEEPTASLSFRRGRTSTATAIVPVDATGRVCATTTGNTDLVLDVVGVIADPDASDSPDEPDEPDEPADDVAAVASSDTVAGRGDGANAEPGECPAQDLFPHWRMVAIYGSGRSEILGVLGEQPPEEAADRLAEVARPYRRGDRPVLPAFELIATLATADPGEGDLYRLPAEDEFVQDYLDAARRAGVYLILDIQPGRSDFLTEAKRYEKFLREPDVGLALDPEWRTEPPETPGGGYVGQVDASEVNAVAEWLSGIVVEEGLPEKLLVLHQFQERMVTNRDQLVSPPGIAFTIHMDGHGTRQEKQTTYSLVHVQPPFHNAVKLFYDEDIDMYRPREILRGAFRPVPELITYQ